MRYAELVEGRIVGAKKIGEGVRWAIGPDLDKAEQGYGGKHDHEGGEYTLVWANIADLFKHTHREFALHLDDPTGGRNAIGNRIRRAHAHAASGGYFNTPVISFTMYHGVVPEVNFGNGRHRLYVAYSRGQEYAPVLINPEGLPLLQQYVRTRDNA